MNKILILISIQLQFNKGENLTEIQFKFQLNTNSIQISIKYKFNSNLIIQFNKKFIFFFNIIGSFFVKNKMRIILCIKYKHFYFF